MDQRGGCVAEAEFPPVEIFEERKTERLEKRKIEKEEDKKEKRIGGKFKRRSERETPLQGSGGDNREGEGLVK